MPRRGENIRKRNDGRWEGRYKIYSEVQSKNVYKSVYGKTYTEVKIKLLDRRDGLNNCNYQEDIRDATLRMKTLAEVWLKKIYSTKKYSTYIKYKEIYENHIKLRWEDISIADITFEKFEKFYIHESMNTKSGDELSKSVMNSIKYVFNSILAESNYEIDVLRSKISNLIFCSHNFPEELVVLSKSEQQKLTGFLCQNINSYKLAVLICLYTGIRIGEVCALSKTDIDIENNVIDIHQTIQRIKVYDCPTKTRLYCSTPKSSSSIRKIPICDFLNEKLTTNIEIVNNLNLNGQYMEPRTLQYHFKSYLREVNINAKKFHSLRHTFATNCVASGMDVKCLSEILGHADIKTTLNRYVHTSFETKINSLNHYFSIYGQNDGHSSK